MASSTPFLSALELRRSIYDISDSSTIPDSRIHEIVNHIVKHAPSAFNTQSARVVVLLKEHHQKYWDIVKEVVQATWPEQMHGFLFPKIAEYRGGYGTALFYEDPATMKTLIEKNAQFKAIAHLFPQWSEHSNGAQQIALWAALSVEGLGCNLQHYEGMENRVSAEWNVPAEWQCKAQLVFGTPTKGPRREKDFLPLEQRVFVHGA